MLLDFVSMNKDFQAFVALVSETIKTQYTKPGPVAVDELLKVQLAGKSSTLQDALGDIISSIRYEIRCFYTHISSVYTALLSVY